jgi:hypothetical protein
MCAPIAMQLYLNWKAEAVSKIIYMTECEGSSGEIATYTRELCIGFTR